MQKIGFIGTGVMGSGIINNLLNAHYDVDIYTRTESKVLNGSLLLKMSL